MKKARLSLKDLKIENFSQNEISKIKGGGDDLLDSLGVPQSLQDLISVFQSPYYSPVVDTRPLTSYINSFFQSSSSSTVDPNFVGPPVPSGYVRPSSSSSYVRPHESAQTMDSSGRRGR